MGGFLGITYSKVTKIPQRSLNGFYGITIRLEGVSIKIVDYRNKGLKNVKLVATNPTSGVSFTGYTDSTGSVIMQLDDVTDITIMKEQITKVVTYNGEVSPTYTIDLDFIQK